MKNEKENTNKDKAVIVKEERSLEKEISFSWGRVIKQGIKNMKDDVDPVYKGAKMGFYSLHGIPTWVREYNDGRLTNDSNGLATLSGMFVAGTAGLGYYIATRTMVAASGPIGYAVLGIPLLATGCSYVNEAFRRAKKKEHIRVIKSRIQRKLETPTEGQWDLSYQDMIQAYIAKATHEHTAREESFGRRSSNIEHTLDSRSVTMELYKDISTKTDDIIDKLYAYNQLGKKYELSANLEVITPNSEKRYSSEGHDLISRMIWDTASKNNGSANVEWLGKVTVLYERDGMDKKYQVTPNKLWK